MIRRIPKRGFTAPFKNVYQIVNVGSLNRFENSAVIGPAELKKAGLIGSISEPIKILGDGKLAKTVTVKAHKISENAKKVLAAAGAKIELLTK